MAVVATHYRPSGSFPPGGALVAALGGIILASLAAGAVYAWESSSIPTFLILTPILQGLALGIGLSLLVRRARVRNPVLAGTIGLLCGALSVVLVFALHYAHDVRAFRDNYVQRVKHLDLPPEEVEAALAEAANPYALFDRALVHHTGHRGLVGHVLFRAQIGMKVDQREERGVFIWVMWGLGALVVLGFSTFIAAGRAAEPFCETCDRWFASPVRALARPTSELDAVLDAVRSGDPRQAAALRAGPGFDETPGSTVLAVHACLSCGARYADVSLRRRVRKGRYKEKKKLKLAMVSPEFVAALAGASEPPAPAPIPQAAKDADEN